MKMKFIFLCMFMSVVNLAGAQECLTNAPQTTPESRFQIIGDGSKIKDLKTELVWDRCLYGQIYNEGQCIGNPIKLNFKEALQTAKTKVARVPNIKEVLSIIEFSCHSPMYNLNLFPDASKGERLMTSTPDGTFRYDSTVITFEAYKGSYVRSVLTEKLPVRLVR